MDISVVLLFILIIIPFIIFFLFGRRKKQPVLLMPETSRRLLSEHVDFYNQMDEANKKIFEQRMQLFLSRVRITGVKTTVEDIDRVLIAASAIIPIFGFPNWEYINLNEVLLYPGSFNETFDLEGAERNTLGVVGTGAYQNIMILSKQGLRAGFDNSKGKDNTAIHEFVHLLDKTDGAVDGIPEFMLSKQYILPWLRLMQTEMQKIMDEHSDINPYGATNQAEFFAVVSEYFFTRPDLLQTEHPELYKLLSTIFRQPLSKGIGNL